MAIAFAVNILSPVIILIFTPAALQELTASLAPGRHGSFSPTNPSKITVAEPIVSQAESFRTIALSRIILFIETARFSVTAKVASLHSCHQLSSSSSVPKTCSCPLMSQAYAHTHLSPLYLKPKRDSGHHRLQCRYFLLSCWIHSLSYNDRPRIIHRQLLMEETARTRKIARIILPPSYHPPSRPSSSIPKPRVRTAQIRRMMMVVSLNASRTKLKKLLAGAFLYVLEPKTSILYFTPAALPLIPAFSSASRIAAIPLTPPFANHVTQRLLVNVERGYVIFIFNG